MPYLCVTQQAKRLSKAGYLTLRELCRASRELYSMAIRLLASAEASGEALGYCELYRLLKGSAPFKTLNFHIAQQTLMAAAAAMDSYRELKSNGRRANMPSPSRGEAYYPLFIPDAYIRKDGTFSIPFSKGYGKEHEKIRFKVPPVLEGKKLKQIKVVPKQHARFFSIQYIYEAAEETRDLDTDRALAVDLGLGNLAACATSEGACFIVCGRRIKSANQFYNKENARLQSVYDKQGIAGQTNRQAALANRRNNKVNDYLNKAARYIIGYCLENRIGNLVVGHNIGMKSGISLGKRANQSFAGIPIFRLASKLEYLCRLHGINFVSQEESYTSKASFWDRDEIPVYKRGDKTKHEFSGRRVSRGVYQTAEGHKINADINGALNILRKSSIVSLERLYSSGSRETPVRVRLA